jgi:hypothetical protein
MCARKCLPTGYDESDQGDFDMTRGPKGEKRYRRATGLCWLDWLAATLDHKVI